MPTASFVLLLSDEVNFCHTVLQPSSTKSGCIAIKIQLTGVHSSYVVLQTGLLQTTISSCYQHARNDICIQVNLKVHLQNMFQVSFANTVVSPFLAL